MGEVTQVWGPALLGLALACTALNLVAAVVLARMALPLRLRARVDRVYGAVEELIATVADIEKKAALWEATIGGLIEENEAAFSRAERKRASAAASVSRARDGAPPAAPATRAAVVAELRSRRGVT